MANSSAILTDAFPRHQRGLALGINGVAGIAGSFLGLMIGGVLAPLDWKLVFLVSAPFGIFGTVWTYLVLHDISARHRAAMDWWGNGRPGLRRPRRPHRRPVARHRRDDRHRGQLVLLEARPVDFDYRSFVAVLLLNGLCMGLFSSPNRAEVMNSLPEDARGAGAGMNATFQNSAMVLSIGIFFSLMITGLASQLPTAMAHGLAAHGVPAASAQAIAQLPPVAVLFAALLGSNPVQQLLGGVLQTLPADPAAFLTGRSFFPDLISGPFSAGLTIAFAFAIIASMLAAAASWLCREPTAPQGARVQPGDSMGSELAARR